MSGERAAQVARARGEHGYYVRNLVTQIIVAGPYATQRAAQKEANRRNAAVPMAPLDERLEVVLVGPDRVPNL